VAEHQSPRAFSVRIGNLDLVAVPLELDPFAARARRGGQTRDAQQQEAGEGADLAHLGGLAATGLSAPSGKPVRDVKASAPPRKLPRPLPKPRRRVHNARPATERSAAAGRALAEGNEKRFTGC